MFADLDRSVRGRLRTLSKDNADGVGRHLVMVGRLLDTDPELAYEHAQAAVRRAGRVDVVREAAGLAAYRTDRYAEALRELRTVRRLNGSSEHLAIMADCERGLGRPERALALAQEPEAETLDAEAKIELAIVVSGARLDLGQPRRPWRRSRPTAVRAGTGIVAIRVAQARAAALEAAGRSTRPPPSSRRTRRTSSTRPPATSSSTTRSSRSTSASSTRTASTTTTPEARWRRRSTSDDAADGSTDDDDDGEDDSDDADADGRARRESPTSRPTTTRSTTRRRRRGGRADA